MPACQVAQVPIYDGAAIPGSTYADVFIFKVREGAKLDLHFEAPVLNDNTVTLSVEVSPDGTTYSATTTGNNVVAITAVALVPGASKAYAGLVLRATKDTYMRVKAKGGGRFNMQVRGGERALQPVQF